MELQKSNSAGAICFVSKQVLKFNTSLKVKVFNGNNYHEAELWSEYSESINITHKFSSIKYTSPENTYEHCRSNHKR